MKAINIITAPGLPVFGIAVVMNHGAHRGDAETEKQERRALRDCLVMALMLVCRYCHDRGHHEPIHFFCDKQKPIEGWLIDAWDEAKAEVEPQYGKKLSRLDFEHSHEFIPLQAADILAYEARKDVRDRVMRSQSSRSKALARLIKAKPHAGLYTDIDIWRDHQRDPKRFSSHAVAFLSPSLSLGPNGVPTRILHDPRPGVPRPGGPAFWKAHGILWGEPGRWTNVIIAGDRAWVNGLSVPLADVFEHFGGFEIESERDIDGTASGGHHEHLG